MFALGKHLQPSLMFAGKAGAYPIEALHSRVGSWRHPTNMILGWKGLSRTNTLAYYKNGFTEQAPAKNIRNFKKLKNISTKKNLFQK